MPASDTFRLCAAGVTPPGSAAQRTLETVEQVNLVGAATTDTRSSANVVKAVAGDLGQVASRIRGQVGQFFGRLCR